MNDPVASPRANGTAANASPATTKVRDVATTVVDTTTETARDLARRTSAGIEANPLSVLVGGVALGVLAGAFVPRSAGEQKLFEPVGKRLTDTAKGAVDAARETARAEFDGLGLSRAAARTQAGKLLEGIVGAISAAATAALAKAHAQADDRTAPK